MDEFTVNEKKTVLDACADMGSIKSFIAIAKSNHQRLTIENEHLKEKLNEEIIERKDEQKETKEEQRDMKREIDGKFEVMFNKIGNINTRIDKKINEVNKKIENGFDLFDKKTDNINKWIRGSLGGILGSLLISIILFFIGKVTNWW